MVLLSIIIMILMLAIILASSIHQSKREGFEQRDIYLTEIDNCAKTSTDENTAWQCMLSKAGKQPTDLFAGLNRTNPDDYKINVQFLSIPQYVSGQFDGLAYAERYPDVKQLYVWGGFRSGLTPEAFYRFHYANFGIGLGRKASVVGSEWDGYWYDNGYLNLNWEVRQAGWSGSLHYKLYGWRENRNIELKVSI